MTEYFHLLTLLIIKKKFTIACGYIIVKVACWNEISGKKLNRNKNTIFHTYISISQIKLIHPIKLPIPYHIYKS